MRADLHVHSAASIDGRSSLAALCESAKTLGLDAIAVCDHDVCTDASGSFPVAVIPSVEITSESGHILGLFLDSPIPADFFEKTPSPEAAIAEIRRHGGLAVLAHPFAPQKLTDEQVQALSFDAIECENARAATKTRLYNHKARALAEKLSLAMVGGSDAHCDQEIGGCITEIDCENASLAAMKTAVQQGLCHPVFVHACRRKYKGLSQWQKHKHGSLKQRLWAFFYMLYCIVLDCFQRR